MLDYAVYLIVIQGKVFSCDWPKNKNLFTRIVFSITVWGVNEAFG